MFSVTLLPDNEHGFPYAAVGCEILSGAFNRQETDAAVVFILTPDDEASLFIRKAAIKGV